MYRNPHRESLRRDRERREQGRNEWLEHREAILHFDPPPVYQERYGPASIKLDTVAGTVSYRRGYLSPAQSPAGVYRWYINPYLTPEQFETLLPMGAEFPWLLEDFLHKVKQGTGRQEVKEYQKRIQEYLDQQTTKLLGLTIEDIEVQGEWDAAPLFNNDEDAESVIDLWPDGTVRAGTQDSRYESELVHNFTVLEFFIPTLISRERLESLLSPRGWFIAQLAGIHAGHEVDEDGGSFSPEAAGVLDGLHDALDSSGLRETSLFPPEAMVVVWDAGDWLGESLFWRGAVVDLGDGTLISKDTTDEELQKIESEWALVAESEEHIVLDLEEFLEELREEAKERAEEEIEVQGEWDAAPLFGKKYRRNPYEGRKRWIIAPLPPSGSFGYADNPSSRTDSLLRTISKRHTEASSDEIDFIISADPSDNKIFSEWMASKVFVDGEDEAYVADVAQYMATLHRSKAFSPNVKLRTTVDAVVDKLAEATPPATTANLERLRGCPNYNDDIVFEDKRFIILEPNTHPDSCCYGEGSNRIWCVSNSEDPSEFGRFSEIRNYGVGVRFFIVVNKILPLKHKFSHVGIVSYDTTIDAHSGGASDMQMIQQAKHRFTEMYGGDFAYTDEYLLRFLQELRERDIMMENYDSDNRMILASELEQYLGQRVFGKLLAG